MKSKTMMKSAALVAAAFTLATVNSPAQSKVDVNAIAKYVYPGNIAESPKSFTYLPDGESYLLLDNDGKAINRYETSSGKLLETVLDVTHTRENSVGSIESFKLSPDGTKILLYTTKTPVYRHSFKADWYVFEIKRNILRPLSKEFKQQQSPLFSPDGRMVAFVVDNNIYIKKIDYDSEVAVTKDGAIDKVINGIPDWTYEEEFATDCSMAWAPDNSTLCYLRYDEERVPKFNFSLYQGYCEAKDEYAYYPGSFSYKYPVAGEVNSVVTLHSYDVETRKIKDIALGKGDVEYIPRIAYGGDSAERLMAVTLNRAQNRMEIFAVNPKSTVAKSVVVEQSKAWLNSMTYEDIEWGSQSFVIFSERSGWNHLYEYSYNGQQLRQISAGNYDVTGYYGQDAQGNAYFQSTANQSGQYGDQGAINRVIRKVDKTGKKEQLVTPATGWASATFSPAMNYYVVNYSNESTAPRHTLCNSKDKELRTLVDNAEYQAKYSNISHKEFFTMQSDGYTLNGYILKPKNFDASKKYPVIMWQYSGPDSQEVMNRWRMDWDYYAATERGFVVVCVDGRGTGARGAAFRNVVYKQLGYYETIDQIAAAKYAASLPYVDGSRIGIAGWSFGGYETLMAISDKNSPYKAAVAIAPVTSWRYYDTVYAERFMLTPGENEDGYNQSAPINRVENVNCSLLMMHGTADDNVHLSNTIEFVSRLQQVDRTCDMLLFPNMNHSINGCNARSLVYGRMIDYFSKNL
jgi:dipeptidyl-peptidase-4